MKGGLLSECASLQPSRSAIECQKIMISTLTADLLCVAAKWRLGRGLKTGAVTVDTAHPFAKALSVAASTRT